MDCVQYFPGSPAVNGSTAPGDATGFGDGYYLAGPGGAPEYPPSLMAAEGPFLANAARNNLSTFGLADNSSGFVLPTFFGGGGDGSDGEPPSATGSGAGIHQDQLHTELLDSFTFYVYCIPLPLIAIFGILGNTVSIVILSRPQMRSSINCCLLALASFDLILIVTSLLMFTFPTIYKHTGYMQWYFEHIHTTATPKIFPLALVGQTSSVYVTLAVTFERYIAVCLPLRARSLCTYGRARLYILAIVLFSVLYNVPRVFEVTTAPFICGEERRLEYRMVPSELRQNKIYIQVYITWMYLVVMFILPFSVLAVFNFFIYIQVRKVNHERQQLSTIQKREISLAVMILIVVAVFFVCNTMALIINILEINGSSSVIDFLTPISNLLVTINSSANFVIYCIFGKKFQRLLLNMFCAKIISRFSTQDGNYLFEESHYHANNAAGGASMNQTGSGIPLGRSMSALRPPGMGRNSTAGGSPTGYGAAYQRGTPNRSAATSRSMYAGGGAARGAYVAATAAASPNRQQGRLAAAAANADVREKNSFDLNGARRRDRDSRGAAEDGSPLTTATRTPSDENCAAEGGVDSTSSSCQRLLTSSTSERDVELVPTMGNGGGGGGDSGVLRIARAESKPGAYGELLNVPQQGILYTRQRDRKSTSNASIDDDTCENEEEEESMLKPQARSTPESSRAADPSAEALLLRSPSFQLEEGG